MTYVLLFGANVLSFGLFNYVGLDFRTFYASAEIGANEGFDQVYSLDLQTEFQEPIYYEYAKDARIRYETVPTPFFPIFIAPLVPLLVFKPDVSFWIYTLLSLAIALWYSKRLINCFNLQQYQWLILSIFATTPAFLNFFYGQVNIWLLVCIGEFAIAMHRGNELKGGLWLAGWLIKPQTLIFILPWLFFGRKYRTAAGFLLGSLFVFISSTILAGWDWASSWIDLLILYPGNLATTNPGAMINLRALALNLGSVVAPNFAWAVTITGIVILTIAVTLTWRTWKSQELFDLGFLANFAAGLAVTWHAHIHMALPLVVPMLSLVGQKALPLQYWKFWIAVQALGLIVGFIAKTWSPQNNIAGLSLLGLNIFFAIWATVKFHNANKKNDLQNAAC